MRRADADLDDFEAALDVALGVGDGLAVLARQEFGQRIILALHQFEKLHQHAHAPLRIGRGPGRLRGLGVLDRLAQFGLRGQRHRGRARVPSIGCMTSWRAPAGSGNALAADEMSDLDHGFSP